MLVYNDGQLSVVWSDAGLCLYLSSRLVKDSDMPDPTPATPTAPPVELTPREREVLPVLVEGLSNKLIGARLGISAHTVKFHIDQIARKLGVDNRVAIVTYAFRNGLAS